jgi:HD-GYP domain-containing protein (c-di-GMP phosphodiesterase class II)
VRWHHEWWNGAGYPDALRQTEIPLGARILRVADSYAAMTDDRPYRAALTESQAREKMIEGSAIEFDPDVVAVLLSLEGMAELRSHARREESAPSSDETTNQAMDNEIQRFFS